MITNKKPLAGSESLVAIAIFNPKGYIKEPVLQLHPILLGLEILLAFSVCNLQCIFRDIVMIVIYLLEMVIVPVFYYFNYIYRNDLFYFTIIVFCFNIHSSYIMKHYREVLHWLTSVLF
jgi:hypothetical protein